MDIHIGKIRIRGNLSPNLDMEFLKYEGGVRENAYMLWNMVIRDSITFWKRYSGDSDLTNKNYIIFVRELC